MKPTNQKAQKHLLPPPAGEGRSNNLQYSKRLSEKAAVLVCLFLFSLPAIGQDIEFDVNLREAYDLALNLNTEEALQRIPDQTLAQGAYIASLAEAIELLVTEDNSKFAEYEERFLKRVDRNLTGTTRDYQFVQAELRLQW